MECLYTNLDGLLYLGYMVFMIPYNCTYTHVYTYHIAQVFVVYHITDQNIVSCQNIVMYDYMCDCVFLSRYFKEDICMESKNLEKCSPSLTVREMQIKTTIKDHYIPSRIAKK